MNNKLQDSDDNNFEIKNYKFNPKFKTKTNSQNNKNTKYQRNDENIPNKKIFENAIPSMTDTISPPNNTLGPTGSVPTLNKQKSNSQRIQTYQNLKQSDDINILRNNYKEKIALLEQG